MSEELREALEEARHELTTLHGLYAFDGAAPEESWRLNTSKTLTKIDEALGMGWAVFALESNGARRLTDWMPTRRPERVAANYEEAAAEDYESHPPFEIRCRESSGASGEEA